MKIADNILAYIRANGIQQKVIVDKCGWSKQKVYSMLHGINRISVEEYGMICKALGVPVEFFYLYNGSVSLPPEIEKTIIDLRKTDEFCMCSCADILRKLMLIGAEQLHTNAEQTEGKG